MFKPLIFLTFTVQLSSAVTHSLQYMVTEVTPGIGFPPYTMVGMVDGVQFVYYDSNNRTVVLKTEWIKKINEDAMNSKTKISYLRYKTCISNLMKCFNQTKGVHTFQWMYGCELDDDGNKTGHCQYGYDGEDFLILDLKTLNWTASVPQAASTKKKWEKEGEPWANQVKSYVENDCIKWLKKYVNYSRATLEKKVRPEVSLFQKDSSSPVVCHATGFFPKAVMISWQKNGEDVHENVELRETLPNQNGTFQKRSVLTVSPEELHRHNYTCVVQHKELEKEMVLKVSERRVLSGGGGVSVGVIVGVVVAVLIIIIVIIIAGVFIWKKKSDYKRAAAIPDENSSLNLLD